MTSALPDGAKHTESEYINADPFLGDESEITCRRVSLRKARKPYTCYGLSGRLDHTIEAGEIHRHERARVDGSFWGEYRICLRCMDAFIAGDC